MSGPDKVDLGAGRRIQGPHPDVGALPREPRDLGCEDRRGDPFGRGQQRGPFDDHVAGDLTGMTRVRGQPARGPHDSSSHEPRRAVLRDEVDRRPDRSQPAITDGPALKHALAVPGALDASVIGP